MEIRLNERTIIADSLDKIHETENGITCCGKPMKMIMHIDGTDFFEETYKCECSNDIVVHTKRDKDDVMMYE